MDQERQTVSNRDEGTPRWVKVFVAVAVLVVVFAVVLLVFGGDHGPGRHGTRALPAIT